LEALFSQVVVGLDDQVLNNNENNHILKLETFGFLKKMKTLSIFIILWIIGRMLTQLGIC